MAKGEGTFVQELANILAKQGTIKQSEAHNLARLFEESSQDQFDDFLLEEGLVDKEALLAALSEYYQVPSFDVVGYFFNHELLHLFPKDFLLRNAFIPVDIDEDVFVVVANRPGAELSMQLHDYVDFVIAYRVGIRRDIEDAVKEFYDPSITEVHKDYIDEEKEAEEKEILHEIEDLDETI
jgi:hypothetical protein